MEAAFKFSFSVEDGQYCILDTIQTDTHKLRMLAVVSAANILTSIPDLRSGELERPTTGALGIAAQYTTFPPHTFVNMVQSQVELIYATLKQILFFKKKYIVSNLEFFSNEDMILMLTALKMYQKWKTEYIAFRKEETGIPEFGDALPFNKIDWTDLTEELLTLFNLDHAL